jgi:hypothetical protein
VRSQNHTFFSLIASDGAGENYLSRLFQACFANSVSFQQVTLRTILEACALRTPVPKADNWECDYQPPTPLARGGRPDLALRPGKESNFGKTIFLESKVGSLLGERQLKKYKKYGTKILVAVTKNRPEVSHYKLRKIRVNSLRWQDLCRALRHNAIKGQKEQFLCQSFAEYLEESGMAYREDITKQHLNEIGALLKKITSRKYISIKRGLAFNHAHNCLELLSDVRASLLERLPKLAQSKWTSWGPGYWHDAPDEGKDITYHALDFTFTPSWRATEPRFSGRFYFYAKGTVQWAVAQRKKGGDYREITHSIDSVSSNFKTSLGRTVRALDPEKMTKTLEEAARKWHISF